MGRSADRLEGYALSFDGHGELAWVELYYSGGYWASTAAWR